MKIPTGKGMFVWRIERIGSPADIARRAKEAGFSHVLVKIADGTDYSDYPQAGELVKALHAVGIEAYGWQYVYLTNPAQEAYIGAIRCQITGCDGFVMDCEKECKNKPNEAAVYCERLTYHLPDDISIGLSSYRYPSLHPELPWDILRGVCAYDMPQVYWEQAHNPADQLARSYKEFLSFEKQLQFIPTGAAYPTSVWRPTPADVQEFIAVCEEFRFPYNFWEWYCAQTEVPELWPVITGATVPDPEPQPERVRVSYLFGLNIRSAPAIADNILGGARYGSTWQVMGRVPSVFGDWIQIAPEAYIAGWYTKAVE